MWRLQENGAEYPAAHAASIAGGKIEVERLSDKCSRTTRRNPLFYNRFILLTAPVLLYMFLEFILTSFEWSRIENYTFENCQPLKPVNPDPDLSSLSPKRKARFKAVQGAIRDAWKGYIDISSLDSLWVQGGGFIPHDDLSPLSKKGNSWLHYAATLHDSIDTLYLANMTKEYDEAVHFLTSYDIQTTSPQATKTFEYSLRILGGLLGAYSLSGDTRLFAAARNAADSLLEGPFQASPSIFPRPFNVLSPSISSFNDCNWFWDWKAAIQGFYKVSYNVARDLFTKEHQTNSLAGVGSFGMEFSFLSSITGDRKYREISDKIFYRVQKYENNGIIPYLWNVMTGEPITHVGSLGSGSDSFYEYLIKIPLLNKCRYDVGMEMYTDSCQDSDKDHLRLYEKVVKETLTPFHVKKQSVIGDFSNESTQQYFPVDYGNNYDHLLCFLPAMLSLGASTKYPTGSKNLHHDNDLRLAQQLLDGCTSMYEGSKTHLSPDTGTFSSMKFVARDPSYYLRPEYVESLFVIYRITKDEQLQEMAWDMFQSLEKYCKISSGGYGGLKDVNDQTKGHVDDMPSFFLAETLKYLLLIFGPDDYVRLEDFVFTTEAHPLRKLNTQGKTDEINIKPFCVNKCRPPTPVPWTLLSLGTVILLVLITAFLGLWKLGRKTFISFLDDKTKTS